MTEYPDPVAGYGYEHTDAGIRCTSCGTEYRNPKGNPYGAGAIDGALMRSHARKCPTNPRPFPIPARCWA